MKPPRTSPSSPRRSRRLTKRLEDSIGLWSWYSFGYWTSTQVYPVTEQVFWLNQYLPRCVFSIALALLLLAASRHEKSFPNAVAVGDSMCTALSFTALVILLEAPYESGNWALAGFGIACVGAQNAWSIVRWGALYASSPAKNNLSRVLVSVGAIAVIKLATMVLPPTGDTLLFTVVLLWTHKIALSQSSPELVGSLRCAADLPNGDEGQLDRRDFASLWQTILAILIFFAVWSYLNIVLVNNIGHITSHTGAVSWAVVATQVADIGVAGAMFAWQRSRSTEPFDWSLFWQVAFTILALGLLSLATLGPTRAAQSLISASAVLVFMFTEYLLIQVGRRSSMPPGTVLGFGFGAVSFVDWAVRSTTVLLESPVPGREEASLLLFATLCCAIFLLPARSPGMQLLAMELDERARRLDGNIDERCASVAREKGLGTREAQVLALLAHGRSVPYIAETLVLSENTVKTYRQRIYTKLGIHSRQELLGMVDPLDGNTDATGNTGAPDTLHP